MLLLATVGHMSELEKEETCLRGIRRIPVMLGVCLPIPVAQYPTPGLPRPPADLAPLPLPRPDPSLRVCPKSVTARAKEE